MVMEAKDRGKSTVKGNKFSAPVKVIFSSLALWALSTVSFMTVGDAYAKDMARYPLRPLKIIVPAAASGSFGGEIRAIAPVLAKKLRVPVVVCLTGGLDEIYKIGMCKV